jgi:hypothetical protein
MRLGCNGRGIYSATNCFASASVAMAYTLDDLNKAKDELRVASDRAENSNRNNPNFGRADIRFAQVKVDIITNELKAAGLLPKTAKDVFEEGIDAQFPNAKSKEIVEYNGRRYRLRFAPARKSRSGKSVVEWSRWWEEV